MEKDATRAARDLGELAARAARESGVFLERMAEEIARCLAGGGKVLVCGNGGSAAEAEHFSGELLGRFKEDRQPLAVISLGSNLAVATAIANDYSYEQIFSRQVEGLGRQGDCLLVLSTSGESENVYQACLSARNLGMKVLALTGMGGGRIGELGHVVFQVPSRDTDRIQEVHLYALHRICQGVEARLREEERW